MSDGTALVRQFDFAPGFGPKPSVQLPPDPRRPPALESLSKTEAVARLDSLNLDPDRMVADLAEAERLLDLAERRFLEDVETGYRAGRFRQHDLRKIYEGYRPLARPGHSARWDEVVSFSSSDAVKQMYNEPDTDGCWRGPWPLFSGLSVPAAGQAVVYHLYDESRAVCYIGSSGDLRSRLKWHKDDGKIFESWLAEPCTDREAAYVAEEALLQSLPALPKYNRKFYR